MICIEKLIMFSKFKISLDAIQITIQTKLELFTDHCLILYDIRQKESTK